MHRPSTRRSRTSVTFAIALVALVGACSDHDSFGPINEARAWRDLGTIPGITHASAVTVAGGTVFVGAGDGVWARPVTGDGTWRRVGLAGLDVQVLRTWGSTTTTVFAGGQPMQPGVKSVYWSTDGGQTWTGDSAGLVSRHTGDQLGMADLAFQPPEGTSATPVLYASMSGTSIARSRDMGKTWTFVVGEPFEYMNYDCYIHVIPTAPTRLYQGCEAPLDHAWIRRYDITDRTASSLGAGTMFVDGISNRRINAFTSFAHAPGVLYAGLEGALLAIAPSGRYDWIYKSADSGGPSHLYTYVRGVWVDPSNTRHVVFGGGHISDDGGRTGLHETFDGGATTRIVQGPSGIDFRTAAIPAAVPIGADGRDLLLVVHDGQAFRVLVREHGR